MKVAVVLDPATLVAGLSTRNRLTVGVPGVPPRTGKPSVDALGVFAFGDERFGLVLSDELAIAVNHVLTSALGWSNAEAQRAAQRIERLMDVSTGAIVDPPHSAQLPKDLMAGAEMTLRAACAPELGARPRVVVTNDAALRRIRAFRPGGVALPPDVEIETMTPGALTQLAETVRWEMRQAP